MSKAEELICELENVVSGSPWHGPSVMDVLNQVDAQLVFNRLGKAHTIAELLLHMVAWTEETCDRLKGEAAKLPNRGNWPSQEQYNWQQTFQLFKDAHDNLIQIIKEVPPEKWQEPVLDLRDQGHVSTHEELVRGMILHHIYHSAQIALLNKQFLKLHINTE